MDKSKARGITYLGKFGRDKVTLSLGALPNHKLVRLSFDLLLMQSWDGSSKTYGESRWNLDVVDGPNLIQTTFGNCGFFSDNNVQNFPDNRPFGAYPAWTGAIEEETLGTIQSWGGPNRTFDCSSIYHLDLAFPHSGNSVKLCFQGFKPDKTWGLRNVQVEALSKFAAYSPKEFASLWEKLADDDPMIAFKAKWDLIAGGPSTVAFLADTIPAPVVQDTKVEAKIATPIFTDSHEILRLHRSQEVLQVIHSPDAVDLAGKLGSPAPPK
jgi:hypothetical protein